MKQHQTWEAGILNSDGKWEYFPAVVPGNVQRDYAEYSGILENIQYGTNVTQLTQVEDCTWKYRTVLDFEAAEDEKVFFVAEGIDYIFDILLDGKKLCSKEGMYSPTELDITGQAKNGSLLEIVIHPHPKAKGSIKGDRSEAAQACKPPVCYGWDWNPRLLISGIWLPAYIETRGSGYISVCEPFYSLDLENLKAYVKFNIECEEIPVITVYDPDGTEVYNGRECEFTLENVRLWWCHDHGKPELYSWKAVTSGDEKTGRIGFKKLRLVRNDGCLEEKGGLFPKEQLTAPITVELNGRKIFAKGTNFVNAEIFSANTSEETYRRLLDAARDANMNILRMWGGAGLAKPEFYDLCDEYGILVWQEFMLACNNYEGTDHYLNVLETEAVSIIKKLRRHVCLAFWCGGNELFNSWSGMSEQSLALRLLNKLCYEYDRNRPFIMTSPVTGMAHGGYLFLDVDIEVFSVFRNSDKTAYSEFGVPSLAPVEQLEKIIPKDELFPIVPTESWICHHAFRAWQDNSWAHPETLEHYFGKIENLQDAVEKSQWLQCEGYKVCFEEGRRQWPVCSMTLNWCFNEPWITAANNSLISYPDIKKPAYYAVRDSLRPIMPSARVSKFQWESSEKLKIEIWYHNDTAQPVSDTVTVSVTIGNIKKELIKWDTGDVAACSNSEGPCVGLTLPAVKGESKLLITLSTNGGKYDNSYTLSYKCKEDQNKPKVMNL